MPVKAIRPPQSSKPKRRSGPVAAKSFAAAAYASGQRTNEPKIASKPGSTRIRHRELLATVNGTAGSFAVAGSYVINPGLAASFPWLSTQAASWEQYRFHRLAFEFVTRSSTATVGSVILAPDYDSLDAPPSSELVATSYRDSTEDAPWKDQICLLDSSALQPIGPRKYIRSGAIPLSDLKTYDGGILHACVAENGVTTGLGKLWVEYDVELFVPQTASITVPVSRTVSCFQQNSGTAVTTGTPIVWQTAKVNGLGIAFSGPQTAFLLPRGTYRIDGQVYLTLNSSTHYLMDLVIEFAGQAVGRSIINGVYNAANSQDTTNAVAYVVSTGTEFLRLTCTVTNGGMSDGTSGLTQLMITAV